MFKLKSSQPIFFDNTEENHIVVSPCVLDNYMRDFEMKSGHEKFLGISAGIFFPVLITLITANFHDQFGIPASGWQGTFVTILIVSFVVMVFFVVKIFRNKNFNREFFINKLINPKKRINTWRKKKQDVKRVERVPKTIKS